MGIDGHLPAHDAQATAGARRTTTEGGARPGGAAGAPADSPDRVEPSGDAALLISALRAANEAPDVRGEAVERARRRLESGQIGADPIRLADAILEDLVVTSELTGGCLVGLLHVRDTVILEYLASLDTAAFDVASQVNALKRLGIRPVW